MEAHDAITVQKLEKSLVSEVNTLRILITGRARGSLWRTDHWRDRVCKAGSGIRLVYAEGGTDIVSPQALATHALSQIACDNLRTLCRDLLLTKEAA